MIHHTYVQYVGALLGFHRLKGPSLEIQNMFAPLPIKIQQSYIAQMHKTNYIHTVSREMQALPQSLLQLHTRQVHLKHKPLIVISAGLFTGLEEKNHWHYLQKQLLAKSYQSKQVIAEKSDHMINHHQPEIIVEAIRDICERI